MWVSIGTGDAVLYAGCHVCIGRHTHRHSTVFIAPAGRQRCMGATLEAAIKNASKGKKKVVQRAQQLLEAWWAQDPRVPEQAAQLTSADYKERRAQMTHLINALLE